jgi:hypothetical protein
LISSFGEDKHPPFFVAITAWTWLEWFTTKLSYPNYSILHLAEVVGLSLSELDQMWLIPLE